MFDIILLNYEFNGKKSEDFENYLNNISENI